MHETETGTHESPRAVRAAMAQCPLDRGQRSLVRGRGWIMQMDAEDAAHAVDLARRVSEPADHVRRALQAIVLPGAIV